MRATLASLFIAAAAVLPLASATAGPALLFDAASGKVLYAEDQDNLWHPASLTKIMTAYLTFDALRTGRLTPEQKITVSEKANLQAPSKVGLPVGAEMTVEIAIKALIVKSANDVAIMLAEAIGGTEEGFVKLMNDTSRRLGMTRTHFENANGLPAAGQVTTARDLARLTRAVVRDYPQYLELWAMPEIQIGKQKLASHNHLLKSYEGADGIKTGFICDSGFNVVASATRDGRKLVAVVLGEPSGKDRGIRAASLLDHGFQMQGWKQLFNSTTIETMPMTAEARPPLSIRDTIIAWDCGYRPPRPVAKRTKGGTAAAAKDKAGKAAKAAPKASAATETGQAAAKAATTAAKPKPTAVKAAAPAKPAQ